MSQSFLVHSDDDVSNSGMDLLINKKKFNRSANPSIGGSSHSIHLDDDPPGMESFDMDGAPDFHGAKEPASFVALSDASSDRYQARGPSQEDIMNEKRELLYQFARMEKKGMNVPKQFTMTSNLEDMRAEFEKLKKDHEIDASVRFQRRMLMACVSGVEFLNNRFDPFEVHLDGWSESVQENINDYDDIFEELWIKYHGKVKMAPELRLLFTLGGSAVWFHMSHAMFRTSMPGIDQVFQQNPELRKHFMDATMKTMGSQAPTSSGGGGGGGGMFGGLGNMMGGLFGGGGGGMPPTQARSSMRGPTDVDDLLNEINNDQFGMNESIDSEHEVFEIFSDNVSDRSSASVRDGTPVTPRPPITRARKSRGGRQSSGRTLEL
jgi:hypothetical protein